MSTIDTNLFGVHYTPAYEAFLLDDLVTLQEHRCELHKQVKSMQGRYNYSVKFWATLYAADDAYWQSFARVASYRGVNDPCTWPSRGPDTRIYADSGTLLYASVDTGEVGVPLAQRRRGTPGRSNQRPGENR